MCPFHPKEPFWFRLDCQAPIHAHQNPCYRLLDGLPELSIHPAPQFLGHPLEVPFEHGRGALDHCGLVAPIQLGQLGLEGCPELLGSP